MSTENFKPWRQEYAAAFKFAAVSAVSFFVGYEFKDNMQILLPALVTSALFAYLARIKFENGAKRKFGKTTEEKAIKALSKRLPDAWQINANIQNPAFGDIDAMITFDNGTSCVVEIKSFEGIKKPWFGALRKADGKPLEKNIYEQVNKQCQIIKASHGVVWLPNAKFTSTFESGGLHFVNGNEKRLIKLLAKLN
jgi:hypothetical protein